MYTCNYTNFKYATFSLILLISVPFDCRIGFWKSLCVYISFINFCQLANTNTLQFSVVIDWLTSVYLLSFGSISSISRHSKIKINPTSIQTWWNLHGTDEAKRSCRARVATLRHPIQMTTGFHVTQRKSQSYLPVVLIMYVDGLQMNIIHIISVNWWLLYSSSVFRN